MSADERINRMNTYASGIEISKSLEGTLSRMGNTYSKIDSEPRRGVISPGVYDRAMNNLDMLYGAHRVDRNDFWREYLSKLTLDQIKKGFAYLRSGESPYTNHPPRAIQFFEMCKQMKIKSEEQLEAEEKRKKESHDMQDINNMIYTRVYEWAVRNDCASNLAPRIFTSQELLSFDAQSVVKFPEEIKDFLMGKFDPISRAKVEGLAAAYPRYFDAVLCTNIREYLLTNLKDF